MFSVEIEYRLQNVFQKDFFSKSDSGFQFVEDERNGQMVLKFIIHNHSLCIMNLDKQNPIRF